MSLISKFVLPLMALSLIAVMIKLGFWQLNRAEYKAEKQTIINTRLNQPARALTGAIVDVDSWQYYRITVSGIYQPALGFLVDNVVNHSVAGVNSVTPLMIEGSQTLVIVNRGWLAWGADRTFLPAVQTPDVSVNLTGLLVPAAEDHFYLKEPDDSGPQQLWSQLDLERFMRLTDLNVQPLILLLDEGQPGAFENIWQFQGDTWIARHKAYAFQWFGLAVTLLIIVFVLGYKQFVKRKNYE